MNEEKVYGVSLKGMRTVFKEALIENGHKNAKIVVIDCETGTATNILGFKREFPDRFVALGVCEQNAVSFAFGIARLGYIPILPLFGSFLTRRACDQIFIQVGYARANIKLIGCYSGLTTPNTGATHQSINDISIIRSIPNICIVEACDEVELRQALNAVVEHHGPVYLRMIRGDTESYEKTIVLENHRFEIGRASVLREGNDVTLIGSGLMVSRCLEAAKVLENRSIHAEVINCSTIKPLDRKTILRSITKTRAAVTAENHSVMGGMGGAVAEMLSEEFPIPLKRVGIEDKFGESGPLEDLYLKYGLNTGVVTKAALSVLMMKS